MNFKIFKDEALESFLLRVSNSNYERFLHFAQDLEERLFSSKGALPGALPTELFRFSLHNSKNTTEKKVRALCLLESELEVKELDIVKLALKNSDAIFSPNFVAVYQNDNTYPISLIRKEGTPVCSECLKEGEYIRQNWQLAPYIACHKHRCDLLFHCPACNVRLDYKANESIAFCSCKYDLRTHKTQKATPSHLSFVDWLTGVESVVIGLPKFMSISERYGFLHWYLNRYEKNLDVDSFLSYCKAWPENLYKELEEQIELADTVRINEWRSVSFNTVFGDLLLGCRELPFRHTSKNIVLQAVTQFFIKKTKESANTRENNFTKVLISVLEASTLLSCKNREVYRLHQHGMLKAKSTSSYHTKLHPHQSAFSLDSVIIFLMNRELAEFEDLNVFLPSW